MGVYVKGMEMPKHCIDCPLKNYEDDCIVQELQHWKDWDEMKAGCPLAEVPTPHRRLIEEPETLCYAGLAKISTHDFRGEAEYFCKQVRAQRTVLEAEE